MRIRRTTPILGIFMAGSFLLGAGCGDDEKKPNTLDTGVDKSKPLGTLTPDEATAVCMSTQTFANRAVAEGRQRELSCRLTGIGVAAIGGLAPGGMPPASGTPSDAELQMACQSAFDQCVMRSAAPASSQPAACQSFPASCTATVGEYEACMNDVPAFLEMSVSTVPSCSGLTRVSLIASFAAWTALLGASPPTCKTFQMKCGAVGIPGTPGTTGGTGTTPPGGPGTTPPAPP